MANFCHECAGTVTPSMKACPNCGTRLVQVAARQDFTADDVSAIRRDAEAFDGQPIGASGSRSSHPGKGEVTALGATTWLGNLGCGVFAGFAVPVAVALNWARLMDANGWDGTTAPDGLFAVHLVGGFVGAFVVGSLVYRWARRRV